MFFFSLPDNFCSYQQNFSPECRRSCPKSAWKAWVETNPSTCSKTTERHRPCAYYNTTVHVDQQPWLGEHCSRIPSQAPRGLRFPRRPGRYFRPWPDCYPRLSIYVRRPKISDRNPARQSRLVLAPQIQTPNPSSRGCWPSPIKISSLGTSSACLGYFLVASFTQPYVPPRYRRLCCRPYPNLKRYLRSSPRDKHPYPRASTRRRD